MMNQSALQRRKIVLFSAELAALDRQPNFEKREAFRFFHFESIRGPLGFLVFLAIFGNLPSGVVARMNDCNVHRELDLRFSQGIHHGFGYKRLAFDRREYGSQCASTTIRGNPGARIRQGVQ